MKYVMHTALALWLAGIGGIAYAAPTDQEIANLGKDLTPVGAQRAGNQDGTIPEWSGGDLEAPPGWEPGQKRLDPYKDDKPLFSIDASNVDEYKDKLSEGQMALIRTLKGYRMDVYPTRRSCGYPDFVYERTKVNAKTALLDSNGWGLKQATGAAIIFPIPKTGAEAIWNHKLRYIGEGREEYSADIIPDKSGDFTPLAIEQTLITPLHNRNNKGLDEVDGVEAKLFSAVVSPAARAGELSLAHGFLNEPQVAWLYFPGQRRVRRVPTYAYDNPIAGYEGLVAIDQYPMFSGVMDRYDWKLVGKQEMLIPYNNWKLIDKSRKYKDVYGPQFVNRDLMRYELHRVWKVEATLKQGMRHIFPKREFYLDEDSWAIMVADNYDAQGKIWRVQESSIYVAPEIPACVGLEFVSYDLTVGRYVAMATTQESRETDWLAGQKGNIDLKRFNPDELRRLGDR